MDETLQPEQDHSPETIHKVPVRFGDVFKWWGQGHEGQEQVATQVSGHLQAAAVFEDTDGNEILRGGGSITGPIQVVGHWDLERALDAFMRQNNKASDELHSSIRQIFEDEEAFGEIVYKFEGDIPERT